MTLAREAAPALRLPRVVRALVAASNKMHRARAELTLPVAEPLRLRLALGGTRPGPGSTALLEGRVGGERFMLQAPWRLAEQLVDGFAPGVRLDPLPGALRGLVLEASLQNSVEFLEKAAGRAITLDTIGELGGDPGGYAGPDAGGDTSGDAIKETGGDPGGEAAAAGHAIDIGCGAQDWVVRLQCSARLWEEIVSGWPVAAWEPEEMTLPATARIGTLALCERVLVSLRPGDVLLGEGGINTQAGRLVLAGGFGADMVKVAENWFLTEAPAMMQRPTSDDTEANPSDGEADLGDIPVRLDFDVGSLDLPLSRLREMDAGTILDLQRGTAEFIGITANGRRIGRGELVDIEGMLGVRITRIFGRE